MKNNKNKYLDLSKEELINLIQKLESRKKYGLIWDEERTMECFDEDSKNALPVLKEVKSRTIMTDPLKPTNILIEGDNYHALSVLNFTHQGKIDVIYIDPPYNTGNKDFVYNDQYVDKEDGYRHSKWLSFMEKRLKLAKNLLQRDGLIFISINDIEQAQLKMLCNEIFGEKNFLANLVWQNKEGGGSSDSKYFRIKHEYILTYGKNKESCEIVGDDILNLDRYKQTDKHVKTRGTFYLQKLGMCSIQYSNSLDYPIKTPDGTEVMPKDNNKGKKACWRWSMKKLIWGLENDFIVFKKDQEGIWQVYTKQYLNCDNNGTIINRLQRPFGVIDNFSSTQATKELFEIDITSFSYPKPKDLISYLISKHSNKSATVLDFMAGSGTTGHAVLELNKKDGGNRQFILCTNNENNIAQEVCYPRIKIVIKGHKDYPDITGITSNLRYFKTAFVKNSINKDELKKRITQECTEMLCLREGIFEEVKENHNFRIFKQNNRILAIYYSLDINNLKNLKKQLNKLKGKKTLYCFTIDSLGLNRKDFRDWEDVILEPIPQKILDIYEAIYEY